MGGNTDKQHFMDMITIDSDDNSIMDSASTESSATKELSKNMLQTILRDSSEVNGDFGDILRDDTISTTQKITMIQQLEEVGLAETVKAFNTQTMDGTRMMAASQLMKIAGTLKGTIKLKHSVQLQEDIDFKHPKVTKAFAFFLQMIVQVLQENGIDEDNLMNILEIIEVQSFQFEEVLQATFKGVPISELSNIDNPFTSSNNQQTEIDYIDVYNGEQEEIEETGILTPKEQYDMKLAGYVQGLEANKALNKKQRIARKIKYKKRLKKELGL